ncbi:MAG: MOSC N-terminal beta barrel domain-containing protein, partial [Alphaproteobacteria bacterium]|nr:MOSC N-terminal beta barrel domain-containing protein [Alphaproteobacteria bacterium]
MMLKLTHIYRYPVKGLSPESMTATTLVPGEGLKHDRRFAIALNTTEFDPASPQWLSKTHFLMLMRNATLALLDAHF